MKRIVLCFTLAVLILSMSACGTPHQHQWGSGIPTRAATCLEQGVITHKCYCGAEYDEYVNPTGHSWVIKSRTKPKFDCEGCTEYECTDCHETKNEKKTIAAAVNEYAKGHGTKSEKRTILWEDRIRAGNSYMDYSVFVNEGQENGFCFQIDVLDYESQYIKTYYSFGGAVDDDGYDGIFVVQYEAMGGIVGVVSGVFSEKAFTRSTKKGAPLLDASEEEANMKSYWESLQGFIESACP